MNDTTTQKKSGFTAGPWSISATGPHWQITSASHHAIMPAALIAQIRIPGDDGWNRPDRSFSVAEQDANAHLIAAAPALYEALEAAREAIHWTIVDGRGTPVDRICLDAAIAALRLARGEG
jgi:hypothetical protein